MTRQLAKPQSPDGRFGVAFVIVSVTLLSLACGAWLISNFGLELSSAMLASLGIYCLLLLLHLVVRRSLSNVAHDDDVLDGATDWQGTVAQRFEAALAETTAGAPPPSAARDPQSPMHRPRSGMWPDPLPMPTEREDPALEQHAPDPFTFRPSRTPYFDNSDLQAPPPAGHEQRGTGTTDTPLLPPEAPEMNVEYIQELIKKLADELNGEGGPDQPDAGAGSTSEQAASMIGRSADALAAAARTMRGAPAAPGLEDDMLGAQGALATTKPLPPWRPATLQPGRAGAPPAIDPQLAQIAEAIASERFEVLL